MNVLCGAVKEFLRSLPGPLVPAAVQDWLAIAATQQEVEAVLAAWNSPQRDTLAFFMLHLQKVARSEETR